MADNASGSHENGNHVFNLSLGLNVEDIEPVSSLWGIEDLVHNSTQDSDGVQGGINSFRNENFTELGIQNIDSATLLNIEDLVQNSTQDSDGAQGGSYIFRNENFTELGIQNIDPAALFNLDSSHLGGVNIFYEAVHSVENENAHINIKEEPGSSMQIPSSLPAVSDWPGDSNFTVSFGPQVKTTKGTNWTFSKGKNKLYVGKDVPCPINFSTNKIMNGVFLRATVRYTSPEHTAERVERCPTHIKEDASLGLIDAEHFVRIESNMSCYEVDPITNELSVRVPFENPPAGQEFSTYIFKFLCFGSCVGGPNRRALMIVFTLEERGGRKIGRRKLELKVCACPGRDCKTEEDSLKKLAPLPSKSSKRKEPESERITFGSEKKTKSSVRNEEGYFTIATRDEECHQFLKEMKKLFTLNKAVNNLPPHARKKFLNLANQRASDQEEST